MFKTRLAQLFKHSSSSLTRCLHDARALVSKFEEIRQKTNRGDNIRDSKLLSRVYIKTGSDEHFVMSKSAKFGCCLVKTASQQQGCKLWQLRQEVKVHECGNEIFPYTSVLRIILLGKLDWKFFRANWKFENCRYTDKMLKMCSPNQREPLLSRLRALR